MPYKRDKSSKHWFSTLGVAQFLDVSVRTVERWRSEGKFTPDKRTPGGHSRYSREQVEKMEEQRKLEIMAEREKPNPSNESTDIGEEVSSPPFDLPTHEAFVKYVDDFMEETGIKPSALGRKALNDSGAIPRLKDGTDLRLSTMHKISDYIKKARQEPELQKMLREMME